MARIAVIDIGTITARLAVSEKEQGSALAQLKKISTICNMGEGTAETGRLSSAAIERVLACVRGYVDEARAMGASACACTLTSAARDAETHRSFWSLWPSSALFLLSFRARLKALWPFWASSRTFRTKRCLSQIQAAARRS